MARRPSAQAKGDIREAHRGLPLAFFFFFFFFVSACKRQVPLTHDVVAVLVTPNDLFATGKETCLADAQVAKKKEEGVIGFGVEAPPAPYKEGSGLTRKRGDVRC